MTKKEREFLFRRLLITFDDSFLLTPTWRMSRYLFDTGIFSLETDYGKTVKERFEKATKKRFKSKKSVDKDVRKMFEKQVESNIDAYLNTKDKHILDVLIALFI